MASEQLRTVIDALRARPEADSIEEKRANMEAFATVARPPEGTTATPVDAGGVPAEWVTLPSADPTRVVLYLHGGGYTSGSPNTHRRFVALLGRACGARVLNIDYRLAPEHPHPAAVEDAVAAYRWLVGQGADPDHIALAGDSAGGGLAAAALVALRDAGDPLPAAAALISPWVDLELTGASMTTRAAVDPMCSAESLKPSADMYLAGQDARTPLASPVYADLSGLPALLIHVGDAEVLLDDAVRLAANARAARVEVTLHVVPEMIHVWHVFAGLLPEAETALDDLAAWLRARLA
jgi:acetyl esterase/lipase